MRQRSSLFIASFLCLASVASAATTITDLGLSTQPTGINASGQVVGSYTVGGSVNAFLYTPGSGMTNLGTLPGGSASYAYGINASGQVVGWSYTNVAEDAFLYTPGSGMTDLGNLGTGASVAYGINVSGEVVGTLNNGSLAFWYTPGSGMTGFSALGGSFSVARAINDAGQIAGGAYSAGEDSAEFGFLYTPGSGMTNLGTLPGGSASYAYGINASGQVVGYSYTAGGYVNAFLYTPASGMTNLGTLPGGSASYAYGINASGQVVGWSYTAGTVAQDAFLYTPGRGMTDLNSLLPANSGWQLGSATGINDSGEIVGTGSFNGQPHGFLLTGAATPVETIGMTSLTVGSAAASSSVEVGFLPITAVAPWTAAANATWLHLGSGSASGTGAAIIQFTIDANLDPAVRTGTITLDSGLTLTVTQTGANYSGPGPVITLVSSGLNSPLGVAVDGSGDVYIADSGNNAIKEWSLSTQQVTTLVSSGLNVPFGVAVDGSGNVYIADSGNNAIKEWSPSTQQVTTLVSTGLNSPSGVAVDGSGNVYIADSGNNATKEWSPSTQQVTTLVSTGLNSPSGVAVDISGNVYIADTGDFAIKEWSPSSSQQVTTLVSAGLDFPFGAAVDGGGNVYIADTFNLAIKEWGASTQQVTTLVSAGLGGPFFGVAVDGSGSVYITDFSNNAIREIPRAFVGPASLTEPAPAGSDSLLQVLPATADLAGIFAPSSDQSWLTIGTIADGVINFSFTANTSNSARTARVNLLGQQITVTQSGSLTALTPAALAFGNQAVGEASSGRTAAFKNGGTAAITIDGIAVSGANAGDFVLGGNCPVRPSRIGAGRSCSITITFKPSIVGSESATLSVTSNSPTSPQAAALTGTGVAPVNLSASTLSLGTVAVGDTTAPKTVALVNHEDVTLTFASILPSAGFAVASNTCGASIAARTYCIVGVTFSPTATGAATGTLTFTDSAGDSPQVVSLTGSGITPVTLSPGALNFGAVAVGHTSAPKTVTLTNRQNVTLDFASILTSAGFGVAGNTCGANVAAGATCTVGVTFSPIATGAAAGSLTFTDDAANSPQVVRLTGTGK